MYDVKKTNFLPSNMQEPWNVSFEKRLLSLIDGKYSGKKSVVYLYEHADTSTFRYRAYNMCQVLSESSEWVGAYFFAAEVEHIRKHIAFVDVVVVIRLCWTETLAKFINEAKKNRIKVMFDVDDLIYDVRYLPMVLNTLAVDLRDRGAHTYWFEYFSRIYLSATSCDAFISTNEYIATHLRNDFGRECYVMPNFLNREQQDLSESLWAKKLSIINQKPFMIGYFSGTPSHQHDFATVAIELKELLEEFDDIKLKIVGFMEMLPELAPLCQRGKIICEPLKDFRELQIEIAEVDVNIIPLVDNDFTNCKSELKYFEAGIVGTLSCAVPTYVYRQIIQQGQNGYLCRPGEWYSRIKEQYLNGTDRAIIENAHQFCTDRYGWRQQLQRLERLLNSIG